MSKQINPIRKNIVKQSILQGKSFKQSLLDAGYTPASAEHSSGLGVVKCTLKEIAREFKKEEITEELVLAGLLNEYRNATKSSDRQNALMLLGKYLSMFTDKQQVDMSARITQEEKDIINRYINTNRLNTI